jgi:hypothetical protein
MPLVLSICYIFYFSNKNKTLELHRHRVVCPSTII